MLVLTRRAALSAPLVLCQLPLAIAATGQGDAPSTLNGAYALPDGQAKVSATLALTPNGAGGAAAGPPVSRMLDIAMTPLGNARPATRYDVELTKQIHVIAVSDDLKTFLHEHGERPGADGHFRVPMRFPYGGTWHIYADAVPSGLPQQVMRFDADLGVAGPVPAARPAALSPTGLEGSDGPYAIRFDAVDLRAGQDAELTIHVLRDGKPASDLTPYLGVAAHAVFVAAAGLAYVHAHAAPAAAPMAGGTGAPMSHDMTGMPHGGHGGHGAMQGMNHAGGHGAMAGAAPLPSGTKVSPELKLHLRAPAAGTYMLWVQFQGGGKVRTVPFVVVVT